MAIFAPVAAGSGSASVTVIDDDVDATDPIQATGEAVAEQPVGRSGSVVCAAAGAGPSGAGMKGTSPTTMVRATRTAMVRLWLMARSLRIR